MSEAELLQEIAALRAEVAALRDQLGTTGMRLGPRPDTQADVNRRMESVAKSLAETLLPVDRTALCTTSGEPPEKVRQEQTESTGQHKAYIVLCAEERAKGFVRPYRDAYTHTRCGTLTTMGRALSETYARDPTFYGSTFCCNCNAHYPVGEFTWTADGAVVGS